MNYYVHPTATHTTHTKNMFIFQISDSIFFSNSVLFLPPLELSIDPSSSSITSAQLDGRTTMTPAFFRSSK